MGKELWFGEFDSPVSRQRFAEFLKKVVSGTLLDVDLLPRRAAKAVQLTDAGISVNELCVAFLRHAEQHYRMGDELTAEYDCFVSATFDCRVSANRWLPLTDTWPINDRLGAE